MSPMTNNEVLEFLPGPYHCYAAVMNRATELLYTCPITPPPPLYKLRQSTKLLRSLHLL